MGATTLITIEPEVLQEMRSMHEESCKMVKQLAGEVNRLKAKKWLNINEVAEKTGYSTSTITRRKSEIGFKSDIGGLIFWEPDVEDWMRRGYNPPKPLPIFKR